ncbi:MAG: outer membrane beta-barrel protein [Burkholderiales bacterium]
MKKILVKKILAALLLTLPTMAVAVDLDGYYITAKGGVSKTFNTGAMNVLPALSPPLTYQNKDLGTGSTFGFSVGKYLTDNFRLELEATKRTGYEMDTAFEERTNQTESAKIETQALFINGFYDLQPFSIRNTPITPYLGGGLGVSRNKLGTQVARNNGFLTGITIGGKTTSHFAYKLSAGTLVSLTEQLSLDVNYQYVNLGGFTGSGEVSLLGDRVGDDLITINGGEIKTQELMVGLQYRFN